MQAPCIAVASMMVCTLALGHVSDGNCVRQQTFTVHGIAALLHMHYSRVSAQGGLRFSNSPRVLLHGSPVWFPVCGISCPVDTGNTEHLHLVLAHCRASGQGKVHACFTPLSIVVIINMVPGTCV